MLLLAGCGIEAKFPWTPVMLSDASPAPNPTPPVDAGAPGDGGATPRGDAGGASVGTGESPPPGPLPNLAGPCDTFLSAPRNLPGTEGTLPAPGPYRPCGVIGGQSLRALTFSRDGGYLAALGAGGQVQVLSATSLSTLTTLARARGAYTAFAISNGGTLVAAASESDGEVDLWRIADHQLLLAADLGPHRSVAGGAVAVFSERRVAASAGGEVVVLDVAPSGPPTEVRRVASDVGNAVGQIAFLYGGSQLIWEQHGYTPTGTTPSVFQRLNVTSGEVTPIPDTQAVKVSADLRSFVAIGFTGFTVWDAVTGAQRGEGRTEDGQAFLSVIGFSAGGDEVRGVITDYAFHPPQYRFQRHRILDGVLLEDSPLSLPGGQFTWSETGDILLAQTATSDGGFLVRVDPRRAQVIRRACAAPAVSGPVGFSRDGTRLLASGGGAATAYDVASGQPLGLAAATAFRPTLLSADGRWAAGTIEASGSTALTPGSLALYDIDHLRAHLFYSGPGQPFEGSPGALSTDSQLLASLSAAGELSVFDTTTARRTAMISLGASVTQSGARVLGISSDDQVVRLGMAGLVRDVSWSDGAIVAEHPVLGSPYAASADGSVVVTSADRSSASIYRDGALVATMPQFRTGQAIAGQWIAALSPDGSVLASYVGWIKQLGPYGDETEIRDAATGELIQVLPFGVPAVLSWNGDLIANGNTLWCR